MTEQAGQSGLLAYCTQTRIAGPVRHCLLIFNIQHGSSSSVCLETRLRQHINVQMVVQISDFNEKYSFEAKLDKLVQRDK